MRLVGSDRGLKEISVNESAPVARQKDGTFHVDDRAGKALVKTGDFAIAGTTFRTARGYRCSCGHLSVFKDSCGKCGATEGLVLEEN